MVVVALIGVLAAGWNVGRPLLSRRQDVAARRAAYESFPVFPGATKVGERSYEIKGDGEGTGDYGLTVTYRLPDAATSTEVIGFYRSNMPPGWHEATDESCAETAARLSPPPQPTAPPERPGSAAPPTSAFAGRLVLLPGDGELAVFAPGTGRPGQGLARTFQ